MGRLQKVFFNLQGTTDPLHLLSPAVIAFFKESSTPDKHRLILRRFKAFKKFDSVNHYSPEHEFISQHSSTSNKWARLINKERKILENDLPDTIYVRVRESRLDLLRAMIIGAEGTTYHNGLFFFDIYFPSDYPNIAPLVYCHVKDNAKLNPLFDMNGRLSLSEFKVWPNSKRECWVPGVSNILDVLLGIQLEVFNKMPFYNRFILKPRPIPRLVESVAALYNDNLFNYILEMMVQTMRNPPKCFEDFVVGHFVNQAHSILESCKTFIHGACRAVEEPWVTCDLISTAECLIFVRIFTNKLVLELSRIGASDCEKFLTEEIINADKSIYEYYLRFLK